MIFEVFIYNRLSQSARFLGNVGALSTADAKAGAWKRWPMTRPGADAPDGLAIVVRRGRTVRGILPSKVLR